MKPICRLSQSQVFQPVSSCKKTSSSVRTKNSRYSSFQATRTSALISLGPLWNCGPRVACTSSTFQTGASPHSSSLPSKVGLVICFAKRKFVSSLKTKTFPPVETSTSTGISSKADTSSAPNLTAKPFASSAFKSNANSPRPSGSPGKRTFAVPETGEPPCAARRTTSPCAPFSIVGKTASQVTGLKFAFSHLAFASAFSLSSFSRVQVVGFTSRMYCGASVKLRETLPFVVLTVRKLPIISATTTWSRPTSSDTCEPSP